MDVNNGFGVMCATCKSVASWCPIGSNGDVNEAQDTGECRDESYLFLLTALVNEMTAESICSEKHVRKPVKLFLCKQFAAHSTDLEN